MADVLTYRRSPAVDETMVGERVVLYHRVTGAAAVLNPNASILWNELSTERQREQLEKALTDRFPAVESSRIQADVESYLDEMAKHQLLNASKIPETATG